MTRINGIRFSRSREIPSKPQIGFVHLLSRVISVALAFLFLTNAIGAKEQLDAFPGARDDVLQELLRNSLEDMDLTRILEQNKLSVTLVDITDVDQPVLAHLNGASSYYAASLPKLAILLAVYEEAHQGNLELDESVRQSLRDMIQSSSNKEATKLYELVGPARIEEILRSDRYRLYDEKTGGGLWVGKPYAKQSAWKRDPLSNLSHGASGIQVARFYYMLERGELADPKYRDEMKSILADSSINHKFVEGMKDHRPTAKMFRKSGTWRDYHSDSALIERSDGRKYIAVSLAQSANGSALLKQIIVNLDKVIDQHQPY